MPRRYRWRWSLTYNIRRNTKAELRALLARVDVRMLPGGKSTPVRVLAPSHPDEPVTRWAWYHGLFEWVQDAPIPTLLFQQMGYAGASTSDFHQFPAFDLRNWLKEGGVERAYITRSAQSM